MQKKLKTFGYLTFSITILVMTTFLTIAIVWPPDIHVLEEEMAVTDHLWSSDGTKIAYIKSSDGVTGELWVTEWGRKIKESSYSDRSAISSYIKKHQLIFTGISARGLLDWQGEWILFPDSGELWKIRDDGSDLTQVTFTRTWGIKYYKPGSTGSTGWGQFIPGTDLVYFTAHNGNGWYRPIVCNDDGSGWYYVDPYWFAGNPSGSFPTVGSHDAFTVGMSPTGNMLLYGDSYDQSWHAANLAWQGPTDLWASNVAGTARYRIRRFYWRTIPYVLGDGNTVIYRYVYGPTVPPMHEGNLYAITMDGSSDWKVLDDNYLNYYATNNPMDPQAFLMTSNRDQDGNVHIFTIKVSGTGMPGTGITQLTEGPYNDYNPIYSPDGQYLMYMRLPEDYVLGTQSPDPYELVIARFLGKQWWRIA